MKFVNLTGRTVYPVDGPHWFPKEIPASGKVVKVRRSEVSKGFYASNLVEATLPEPQEDTLLIVSIEVRLSHPERLDLISTGQNIGRYETQGFIVNAGFGL